MNNAFMLYCLVTYILGFIIVFLRERNSKKVGLKSWKSNHRNLTLGGNIICLIVIITALLLMIVTIARSKNAI